MYSCPVHANQAIPKEYRAVAEALFPPEGHPPGPRQEAARAFAKILGIGADYERLLAAGHSGPAMRQFLGHFQNNLDLLIQKTWVEKADELRKEKLQDRVPLLIEEIERQDFQRALGELGAILDELAYLFFGVQSQKEDFTEYTFRIDTQMGLFWWYGARIGGCLGKAAADNESLQAVLLIGICYLTNF
jgi:hypothetical protein